MSLLFWLWYPKNHTAIAKTIMAIIVTTIVVFFFILLSLSIIFNFIDRNYILPGYVDDCFLLAFGAVQGEVFKYRIEAHLNPGFAVADRA